MTALEVLERCRRAEADRRAVESRIQRYRDSATRITSTIGGEGSRGTSDQDRMAAIMGEIDQLERAAGVRRREYAAELAAANRLLDGLPEVECAVLDRFYLRGLSMAAVARVLGYSYGYVRGVKVQAQAALSAIPESEVARLLPDWYPLS